MNPYTIKRGSPPSRPSLIPLQEQREVTTPAPVPLIFHRGGQKGNTNAFKHGIYSKRSPNAIALNMTLAIQHTREANAAQARIKQETTPSGTPVASTRILRQVKARLQLMELTLKAQSLTEKTGQLQQQYDLFEGPLRLLALASNAVTLTSLYKVKLRSWEQRQLDKLINKFLSSHDLTTQQTEKVRRVLTKTYSKYTGKKLSPFVPSPKCLAFGGGWEGVLPDPTYSGQSFSPASFLHDRAWHWASPEKMDTRNVLME